MNIKAFTIRQASLVQLVTAREPACHEPVCEFAYLMNIELMKVFFFFQPIMQQQLVKLNGITQQLQDVAAQAQRHATPSTTKCAANANDSGAIGSYHCTVATSRSGTANVAAVPSRLCVQQNNIQRCFPVGNPCWRRCRNMLWPPPDLQPIQDRISWIGWPG